MKLDPSETPAHYASIQCIKEYHRGVKLIKNTNSAYEVFFHVIREPRPENISSPDDIETVAAYQVQPNESERQVLEEAQQKANATPSIW